MTITGASEIIPGLFRDNGGMVVNVMHPDYGAVNDGATSDASAIGLAVTAATALVSGTGLSNVKRPVLYFPFGLGYLSATGITVPAGIDVVMDAPLLLTGTASSTKIGLTIGSATALDRQGTHRLDVRRVTQSDWTQADDADVGILLQNVCSASIEIARTQGWREGVILAAKSATGGVYFNRVQLGELRGHKYGLTLSTNDVLNACNSNQFSGGEIANASGETVAASARYGVRFRSSGTGTGSNTNTFTGQSFELNATLASPAEAIPVLIEDASALNYGYKIRSENNTDTLLKETGDARLNRFEAAYTLRTTAWPNVSGGTISSTSKYQTSRVFTHYDDLLRSAHLIFDSGVLGRKVNQYDGSTFYTVDGLDICDGSFILYTAQTGIVSENDESVVTSAGRNLVRFLDTTVNKRFLVVMDFGTSSPASWSFAVKPFDAKRLLLSDNPTPRHVYGEDGNILPWNAGSIGGSYIDSGTIEHVFFSVDSLTKSVAWIVGGASTTKPHRMKIYALDHDCTTWQEKREVQFEGEMIATAVPNAGSWVVGDRIWHPAPAVGSPVGWHCRTSGTYGALGAITATTTSASDQVTVNSATGLEKGMFITIVGVTGTKRILGISSTALTIDSAASASVAGAVVAYAPPVVEPFAWKQGTGSNVGDASVTLTIASAPTQTFATALTANRTVTMPADAVSTNGMKYRIVRTGLGAFTLTVQDAATTVLKAMPSATAAFVDAEFNGTNWKLAAYSAL